MAIPDLKIFAEVLNYSSPDDELSQRRDLYGDEFSDGLPRQVSPSVLQLDQILNLLSISALPSFGVPVLHPDTLPLESNTIYAEGQTITETNNHVLYSLYGGTLPDLSGDAPTGFRYVFRDNNYAYTP